MAESIPSDWKALARDGLRGLLLVLPGLLIIVYVASHHARLFGTDDYQDAVAKVLAGEDSYVHVMYDERAFQRDVASRLSVPISVLVAGSSRLMQLDAECFPGRYYNASMSAASVADVAAVLEEFRAGRQWRQIYLAGDPWMMEESSRFHATDRVRLASAPAWVRQQLRLGLTPSWDDWDGMVREELEPYREILAPNVFQAGWQALVDGKAAEVRPDRFAYRRSPDGSLTYPEAIEQRDLKFNAEAALELANGHVAAIYNNFRRIDPVLSKAFEAMASDLKAAGVRVTLVLAPFHPVYYSTVVQSANGKIMGAAEQYYRQVAQREGYRVIGMYDPAASGFGEADFLDGAHLRKSALKRLLGCGAGARP